MVLQGKAMDERLLNEPRVLLENSLAVSDISFRVFARDGQGD